MASNGNCLRARCEIRTGTLACIPNEEHEERVPPSAAIQGLQSSERLAHRPVPNECLAPKSSRRSTTVKGAYLYFFAPYMRRALYTVPKYSWDVG